MLFPDGGQFIQILFFGIILLSVGIPHGAIDHLISNPNINKKGLGKFLMIYLTLIATYLAVWYLTPKLALVAFLIMSAYHFGQTHFLSDTPPKRYSKVLFISRGGFFLLAVLLGDWEATKGILSPLLDLEYLNQSRLFILMTFLFTTLLSQSIFGPKFTINHLLELLIMGPILFFSPLLIGFVVYFGFWHALPSMITEYKFLKSFSAYNTVKKFTFQLLPFSLISFFGIGVILLLGLNFLESSELILLFFVMISLISFPHILYMDNFLKKQNQN
jgi:beta-carotene 15,15'-dioxygenase